MRHTYDPRTNVGMDKLWHADPTLERFIRHTIAAVKPDCFVETGTFMGWTSGWLAENYPEIQVHTVEIDDDFYQRSGENLAPFPNVRRAHDHSVNFLWKLLPELRGKLSLFWLDAHWYPPPPLREECRIVATLDRYVCLLDDFQCYAPDFNGDIFYSMGQTKGDAYKNDLSYTASEFGAASHYRPNYQPRPGFNGVGCFIKGVDYVPPLEFMRPEDAGAFLRQRPASPFPLHPSFEVR